MFWTLLNRLMWVGGIGLGKIGLGGVSLPLLAMIGAALAVSHGAVYAYGLVREAHAVADVRIEEADKCTKRIDAIKTAIDADVARKVAAARQAAAEVADPKTDAELIAICKRSASCRSRGDLP